MADSGTLDEKAGRRRWMGVLAKSPRAELEAELAALGPVPEYRFLREPEIGLALVRGRIGATGGAFNLGEATMTRCVVELGGCGAPGFAFVAGRDARQAELAAVFDAILQEDPAGPAAAAVERLETRQAARRAAALAAVQPTKVEFFTMVRE